MAVSPDDIDIPKRRRINCSNCGYRIPSDAIRCPHCRQDPRQFRLKWTTVLLLIVSGALLIYLCFLVSRILFATQFSAAIVQPTPTPTQSVTPIITVVIQETATITPITLPPTLPASATPTMTSRFTPSPTRRGVPTATPTLGSPTPKPADYAAPKLAAPEDGASFSGADASIFLEWQAVSAIGLRENEWYLVTVLYVSRNGATTWTEKTREIRWRAKKELWSDALANNRTFTWNIQVMRGEGANPYSSPNPTPASPSSETRTFVWQ
jgi:hypothetical protein